jgi:thiol-disulfide isomerase/thioredoxin
MTPKVLVSVRSMNVLVNPFAAVGFLCAITLINDGSFAAKPPIREAPRVLRGTDHGIGSQIPDLEFTDLNGAVGRLSDLSEKSPLVILITGTGCPLCQRYAPSLAKLEKDYHEKGVQFLFVNPNKAEKLTRIQKAVKTHGFTASYVRDTNHAIIRALAAKTTTEAFVLDSHRKLVYRGAVDDQYGFGYALNAPRQRYLRNALDAVLQGRSPGISATSSPGCELWIDDERPVTTGADSGE